MGVGEDSREEESGDDVTGNAALEEVALTRLPFSGEVVEATIIMLLLLFTAELVAVDSNRDLERESDRQKVSRFT